MYIFKTAPISCKPEVRLGDGLSLVLIPLIDQELDVVVSDLQSSCSR